MVLLLLRSVVLRSNAKATTALSNRHNHIPDFDIYPSLQTNPQKYKHPYSICLKLLHFSLCFNLNTVHNTPAIGATLSFS